jgi:hypothetical protein
MTRLAPTPAAERRGKIANLGETHETGLRSHDARTKKADALAFWRGPLAPVEALLPPGVDPKRLRQMPASYRRSYVRTVQGKASPKTAIRLFCLECIGWQRVLAVTCPTRACPLWAMLPRRAEDDVRDGSPAPLVQPG